MHVPGFSNIQLAGRAPGTSLGSASAPLNSPVLVEIPLVAGLGLRVNATGLVSTRGQTPPNIPPAGDPLAVDVFLGTYRTGGVAGLTAPEGALVGIFLGDQVNDDTLPPSLSFEGGATDLQVLRPLLQQPFLIGGGVTETEGLVRTTVIPPGATRLYLGVADGNVADNSGEFIASVSVVGVPTLPANPIQVHGISYLQLAGRDPGTGSTIFDYSAPTNSPAKVDVPLQAGERISASPRSVR